VGYVKGHCKSGRENDIRQIFQYPENAGYNDRCQKKYSDIGGAAQGIGPTHQSKINHNHISEEEKKDNGPEIVEVMCDIKFGRPPQSGNIGYVIPFENRHLAKSGQTHHEKQKEIDWFDEFLFGIFFRCFN
jgi:hypothetical protein